MLRHILKYRICTQQIIEIWLSILLSMLHKTVILLSSLYISVSSQVTGDTVFTRSLSLPGLLCSICPLWCRIATSSLTWSLGSLQMRLEIYDKLICYFVYRELGFFFFFCYLHMFTIHRQHYVQPRNSSDVIAVVALNSKPGQLQVLLDISFYNTISIAWKL